MRDYAELEKRYRAFLNAWETHCATAKPDQVVSDDQLCTVLYLSDASGGVREAARLTLDDFRATADAIAELTKRCEEARKDALEAAASWADDYAIGQRTLPYWCANACADTATIIASQIRAMVQYPSQRQLPSNPLPNDPANGDENAPTPGDRE